MKNIIKSIISGANKAQTANTNAISKISKFVNPKIHKVYDTASKTKKKIKNTAKKVEKKAISKIKSGAKKVGKVTDKATRATEKGLRKYTPIGVLEQTGGLIDDKVAQYKSKRNLKKIQKKAKKK